MLVLFDNGTPRTLARYLTGRHMVTEARARGWDTLENGDLLAPDRVRVPQVLAAIDQASPGNFIEVEIPFENDQANRPALLHANSREKSSAERLCQQYSRRRRGELRPRGQAEACPTARRVSP